MFKLATKWDKIQQTDHNNMNNYCLKNPHRAEYVSVAIALFIWLYWSLWWVTVKIYVVFFNIKYPFVKLLNTQTPSVIIVSWINMSLNCVILCCIWHSCPMYCYCKCRVGERTCWEKCPSYTTAWQLIYASLYEHDLKSLLFKCF